MSTSLCLIGTGRMALDYAKVLKAQGVAFETVGRGEENVRAFEEKTGSRAHAGGIDRYLDTAPAPSAAIVAVGFRELAAVSRTLIERGTRKLLIEKPAGADLSEVSDLGVFMNGNPAQAWVAYNRRFYTSVRTARERIDEDGGPTSFHFEFTETPAAVERYKRRLLFVNSTHVVDLAFYLGGEPDEMTSRVAGSVQGGSEPLRFAGSGRSKRGALFTYCANWEAPGRWGVEVMTRKRRYILRPLEKLQVQEAGSMNVQELPLDDLLDADFKPGIYRQTEAFRAGSGEGLMPFGAHLQRLDVYRKMGAIP